jgi:hypothetical protein
MPLARIKAATSSAMRSIDGLSSLSTEPPNPRKTGVTTRKRFERLSRWASHIADESG